MTDIIIRHPEPPDSLPLILRAGAIHITDRDTHGAALETIRAIRTREREIEDLFKEPKSLANKAHKSVCALETTALRPLQEAREIIDRKAQRYEAEQKAIAEAETARLTALARKAEEDRIIAAAVEYDDPDILDEPIAPVAVIVAPEISAVQGVNKPTTHYAGECTDILALARHVIEHPEDRSLLTANPVTLNARARSQREAFALPGCRLVTTQSRGVRG